jgi:hypothetical protein
MLLISLEKPLFFAAGQGVVWQPDVFTMIADE